MKSERRKKTLAGRFFVLALLVLLIMAALQNVQSAKIEVGNPFYYSVSEPQTVALGDVDGDGHLDIITGNDLSSVSTLYNDGNGSYVNRTDSTTLWSLFEIDTGDIDGDGDLDVVVGSGPAFGATVLINNGTGYPILGTGAADGDGRTDYSYPSFISDVCFGDMDGDDDLDLLVPSEDNIMGIRVIVTLRNNGSGGFGNRENLQADLPPNDLELMDWDLDGMNDIVGVRADTLSIYLNNGSGGFPLTGTPEADGDGRTDYSLKSSSHKLNISDLNNDTYPDLALLSSSASAILVYFSNETGSLSEGGEYKVGNNPSDLACADMDGDGDIDMVTANQMDSTVTVWYNNGQGDFSFRLDISGGKGVNSLDLGDVDSDGDCDIVVSNGDSANTVTVILNRGGGTFGIRTDFTVNPTDYRVDSVAIGNADNDGNPDVVVSCAYSDSVALVRGNGGGGFSQPVLFDTGPRPYHAEIADVNGDGWGDILCVNDQTSIPNALTVLLNDGSGNFPQHGTPAPDSDDRTDYLLENRSRHFRVADMDGDTHLDVIAASYYGHVIALFKNDGTGDFSFRTDLDLGSPHGAKSLDVGDVDGDGHLDIVAGNVGQKSLIVLINDGFGNFPTAGTPQADGDKRTDYPIGETIDMMCLADVDDDGDLDAATVADHSDNKLVISINDGSGAFSPHHTYSPGAGSNYVKAGDLDGDGYQDIAVVNIWEDTLVVLVNNQKGGYFKKYSFPVDEMPVGLAFADLDGDFDLDAVVANRGLSTISVYLNQGETVFPQDSDGDGVADSIDAFKDDSSDWMDSDSDGYGDNSDQLPWNPYEYVDSDGDGYGDQFEDAFTQDPTEWQDSDGDGWGDNSDMFPQDNSEWLDSDLDGVGDNADFMPYDSSQASDSDGDGYGDNTTGTNGDEFPLDSTEWWDSDFDGYGDNFHDDFPSDITQWSDADGDGFGDNPNGNNPDEFPNNPVEWADNDGDGIGDNGDDDDDNDGYSDSVEQSYGTNTYDDLDYPPDFDGDFIPDDKDDDDDNDGFSDTIEQSLGYDSKNATDTPPDFDGDGIPDAVDEDDDNDGFTDGDDDLPKNASESKDTDSDGIGNNQDTDDDNDGVSDDLDDFPENPNEVSDSDNDGIGDNADSDDDNDGWVDSQDHFPNDELEWEDTDSDGTGDNSDTDDDGDGVPDSIDDFPKNPNEVSDSDSDGIGDNSDSDDDNDGVIDSQDKFPNDENEWEDSDSDGIGDNTDTDDDGDGVPDSIDDFPTNPNEVSDSDEDGIGDIADSDDDNDGIIDSQDDFPFDSTEWEDTDDDGIGNEADTDDDNDGYNDPLDEFPLDMGEWSDFNGDGIGDNSDNDIDGDGYINTEDAFPNNPAAWKDTDSDGYPDEIIEGEYNPGNLSEDDDDDNDGYTDSQDDFPVNPNEWSDTDSDGIGDNTDSDMDNDGWSNNVEESSGSDPLDESSMPQDSDSDGVADNADLDDDNDGVLDYDDFAPLDASVQKDPNLIRIAGVEFEVGELVIGLLMAVGAVLLGFLVFTRKKRLYNRYKNEIGETLSVSDLNEINSQIKSKGEKEQLTYTQMAMLREQYDERYMNLRDSELEDELGELPTNVEERIKEVISDKIITEEEFSDMEKWLMKLRNSKTFDSEKKERLQEMLRLWIDENIE